MHIGYTDMDFPAHPLLKVSHVFECNELMLAERSYCTCDEPIIRSMTDIQNKMSEFLTEMSE